MTNDAFPLPLDAISQPCVQGASKADHAEEDKVAERIELVEPY